MLTANLRLPAFRMPNVSLKHGLASLVLLTVFALNLFAGIALFSGLGGTEGRAVARVMPGLPGQVRGALPPAPEPLQFRADVAPQDAVAINAAVPIANGPNPAASAFALAAKNGIDATRALDCLTSAIYYEAATESDEGKRAVAQVVLNRMRHPAYPNTVCGVVFQGSQRATGCQFTFTCDGSLVRAPMASYWNRARAIAQEALAGKVYAPVGWATHYHTNYVVPYWSSSLVKVAVVGTHIFYRWTGGWGRGPAFADRHAGGEPDVSALGRRTNAPVMSAEAMTPEQAAAMAKLTPEQAALAEKGPDGKPLPPSSMDSFQRAVLRRYEPMQHAQVTSMLAAQAAAGDKAISHRWALSGQGTNDKAVPFGKKVEKAAPADPKSAEAKPAAPVELEGVRKVEPAKPASSTPAS
jgi:spore germination cell wall hydrolase CwlJ-like protein